MKYNFLKKTIVIVIFFILIIVLLNFLIEQNRFSINICSYKFSSLDTNDFAAVDFFKKGDLFDDGQNYVLIIKKLEILDNISNDNLENTRLCIAKKNANNWNIIFDREIRTFSLDNDFDIKIEDFNFDQKKDIQILQSIGYSGLNNYYNIFLNQGNGFVEVEKFSQISNPSINKDAQIIQSISKSGTNSTVEDKYKWNFQNIILFERVYSIMEMENDEVWITRKYSKIDLEGKEIFEKEERVLFQNNML